MDSSSTEIVKDFQPFFRVYKDGRVERYHEADFVPPSQDPKTGVISKDVIISPENNVSARLYRPKTADNNNRKLPLLIYINGGGFCIESAFSSLYHKYINHLVAEADAIAVSVQYRLAPEHPIPACYGDSWRVVKWVALHANNSAQGPEPWLRDHVDFTRIYLAGDSAGANIAHDMMVRATTVVDGRVGDGVNFVGMALIHPFFGDGRPNPLWVYMCRETTGLDDPRLNPAAHPHLLSKLVCPKVLICTAEKDFLSAGGWAYYEALKNSGWPGELKIIQTEGESHVFHLFNPTCENAAILLKQVASFIKERKDMASLL